MVLAPDIPAPRDALSLFPPEREILASEKREWGLLNRWRKLRFRTKRARLSLVERVTTARGSLADLSPDDLRDQARAAGIALASGPVTLHKLAAVMTVVDEALFRARGFRFHDTQLQAGLLLSTGHFAEMATGEGKTLTATLPVAVHGLAGCGAHVVTVNDYLAERDAEEVTPILEQLGLSVGCAIHDMEPAAKKQAYGCDVTYCANKELVFDYLRERARVERASPLAYRLQLAGIGRVFEQSGPLVHRLDFVLIDEADSVLIDEANIPLILTEPVDDTLSKAFVGQAIDLVATASEDVWEAPDALGYRGLRPEALIRLIREIPDAAPEWKSLAIAEEMISKARMAQDRFTKDVHYIVEEDKIVLVDPQTGRPTPDRTLPWGVQQVIEYREGLEVSSNRAVIAKQSFQNFFRRYHKLAGMSGTIKEVRRELSGTYATPIAKVPTHRPVQRKMLERHVFETTAEKLEWAIARADRMAAEGRAILIGVSSVLLSEQVSDALSAVGRPHDVLNARRLEEEAEIVATAGQAGRVTVVTNMAGRGTDIKLPQGVKDAGGLHVIILDTLDTSRLERQLFGRAGRQGDPGSYDIAHALDEPELKRMIGKTMRKGISRILSLSKPLAVRVHFPYVEWRRNRLEKHRRNRRLKLLKSEEKRNELLAFTRAD
ncbi:preprotein translocase subunit SecA [Rhodobacter sp. JA431]|uniref:preprotein translocase subunit SecA n=1 Tax=Rhodobacter sp. JA431 TaxID=570013 RepID=UPI000BD96BBD|nr:preprotein translocase subunit SecA [Rhodobacter sp. JA431]SOB89516.1 preprotein translocase subunit SecA [Rhodobacter sp. JA431]